MNINIFEAKLTTVRELELGEWFITRTRFRHPRGPIVDNIRKRTSDPFVSLTYYGSKVTTFPSDPVFPLEISVNSP